MGLCSVACGRVRRRYTVNNGTEDCDGRGQESPTRGGDRQGAVRELQSSRTVP